jgi:23S rRNA pseudouridine1911/1915/1917 synthase
VTTMEFKVSQVLSGERLDIAVSTLLSESRTSAADLIDHDRVIVNGKPQSRSYKVHLDDVILVLPKIASEAEPELIAANFEIEIPVLYSDDQIVVINKPTGVAAHASVGWQGPNVLDRLVQQQHRISTSGAPERQGIVQRLDVGTSGVMVIAKSEAAYTSLKQQFRERSVKKIYLAIVQGYPDPAAGTIDAPIGRHPGADYKFAVIAGGRPSITHYDTIEMYRYATLLRVELETGRTHQIRVHMAAVRHPCVGDLTYGADPTLAAKLCLTRQWLHAAELEITHPLTGELCHFTAPLAADLAKAQELLATDLN